MVQVIVEHRIADWDYFANIFKDDGDRRRSLGSTGGRLYRNVHDPNNIFVVFEWNDIEGAQKFVDGLETHEAMEWATAGIWSRLHVVEEVLEVDA